MVKKALEDVKILELCQTISGSYCAKTLADLGAEVIKIENPIAGDTARQRGPFLNGNPDPETSGLFLYLNTSKLGITLDIENPTGIEIFRNLVKQSDILVNDMSPQIKEGLRLGYNNLKSINPRLIMTSVTLFGQTGPYSNYKSYPLNTFHAGGEGYLTPSWMGSTYMSGPPLKQGRFVGEYEGGISATVATLAALYQQRISGQGQDIDISKQQALAWLNIVELDAYPNRGWLASRATRTIRFGGIMPCKEGYIELSLYEEHQWKALVQLMGNPEWAQDDKFSDRLSRSKNGSELNQHIEEWTKQHTKKEIHRKGQELGCPVAPYNTTEEVVNSEQMKAREFFTEIDHPKTGNIKYPSSPCRLSETPWKPYRPAPLLGQHNEEIYCQRLSFSKQELADLRKLKII